MLTSKINQKSQFRPAGASAPAATPRPYILGRSVASSRAIPWSGPHLTSRGHICAVERAAAHFSGNALNCASANLAFPGNRQHALAGP